MLNSVLLLTTAVIIPYNSCVNCANEKRFLIITVMEEATKLAREDGPWELLYADDLVLTGESNKEVTDMFNRWKEGMEQRGLKINKDKINGNWK